MDRGDLRVHHPLTITMTPADEHIPAHCREFPRFKKVDSTSDLCFPVHDSVILHHHSTERFSCTFEGTFQWPARNPQQWSKPSGIKEKEYWTFKPCSFPSSNLKYNTFYLFQKFHLDLFQHILVGTPVKTGKSSKQLSFGSELSVCLTLLKQQMSWYNQCSLELPPGQRLQDFHPRNLPLWQGEHLEITTPAERLK